MAPLLSLLAPLLTPVSHSQHEAQKRPEQEFDEPTGEPADTAQFRTVPSTCEAVQGKLPLQRLCAQVDGPIQRHACTVGHARGRAELGYDAARVDKGCVANGLSQPGARARARVIVAL